MARFPIFVELGDCLVVGGGTVAARKTKLLLDYGARVTVVAREVGAAMQALAATVAASALRLQLCLHTKPFEASDVAGMDYVIAATDDGDCNRAVAAACRAQHIPVNVVDVPALCDFYVPALVRRGDLVVAVGTDGKSPAFARAVKERIDTVLPQALGAQLDAAATLRAELLQHGKSPAHDSGYSALIASAFSGSAGEGSE